MKNMKKVIVLVLLSFALSILSVPVSAQIDLSSGSGGDTTVVDTPSVEEQAAKLLANLNSAVKALKHERDRKSKIASKKLKLIAKRIDRALKLTPQKCFDEIKIAMDDFFGVVSDLNVGISCGPAILPPFLDREVDVLTPDCGLPPDEVLPDQLGSFGEVNPIYEDARDLFHIDVDSSNIPDACEGTI